MKKLLLLLLFSFGVKAQNIAGKGIQPIYFKVLFEYDTAGNQIKRELCINCPIAAGKVAQKSEAPLETLQQFNPEDTFSYYPNPVQEQLYLKWQKASDTKLLSIQIFSLNGQIMKTINQLESKNEATLAFQNYPQGVYSVLLTYSDGEEKSIKIIKQ
jgi:hypothetical protein